MFVIILRLWVISIIDILSCCWSFFKRFNIWVWMVMLSVVVGLFVIKSLGLYERVIVIIIFWCILFENLCGYCESFCLGFGILISFNILIVFFLVWVVEILLCIFIVFISWFLIVKIGFKEVIGFWNIILILFFFMFFIFFLESLSKFLFLNIIWLLIIFSGGVISFMMDIEVIFLLFLDLFIIFIVCFLYILNEILFIVFIFLIWVKNDVFKFFIFNNFLVNFFYFKFWKIMFEKSYFFICGLSVFLSLFLNKLNVSIIKYNKSDGKNSL